MANEDLIPTLRNYAHTLAKHADTIIEARCRQVVEYTVPTLSLSLSVYVCPGRQTTNRCLQISKSGWLEAGRWDKKNFKKLMFPGCSAGYATECRP